MSGFAMEFAGCVDAWMRGCVDAWMRVDGSRVRKKKLRIQEYLDTCGRVLSY